MRKLNSNSKANGKNIMKRGGAITLAAFLALTMLPGCGAKTDKESLQQTEGSSPEETDFVYDPDKASWQQDTSPLELEWFVAYDWADLSFDPENNKFDEYVYTNTGITIKFTIGSQEKLNVLMATESLPDLVTYDAASMERVSLEESGQLLPLDELKEKYAPDMQVPQAQIDWYTNAKDGHWYSLVGYFYDLEDTYARGGYIETHNMNFARKDIMEDLGIDPASMNTKEGFIAALQKVKDANVTYNGQTVIPYIGDEVEFLAEQFGMDRENKEGELLNAKRQPEFLEALLFLNEIYTKGLTTDEIFTMDTTLRRQLVSSGSVFAGTRHNYLNGKDTLFYADPDALMIGTGLITGDSGKEAYISPSPTGGWAATMITSNCKNPQRAAALLSFMTQPEISLSYYYGGIDGYDIIDGKAIIKPEREAERTADTTAFNAKYRSTVQDLVCDYVWVNAYEPTETLDAMGLDKVAYTEKWVNGHIFDGKIFTDVAPEAGSDLAAISAQLNAYWGQQFPMIVMAKTPEEATQLYNDTIAQMDIMGMADLDAYQNERFQENKKKMGLDFAWPRNQ